MYSPMQTATVLPTRAAFFREAIGVVDMLRRRRPDTRWTPTHRGDGRSVMVIPGFLATDASTVCLRAALERAGYDAHGWELGVNRGATSDLLDRLSDRLDEIGGPVVVIGWSLGGVYARELAKIRPDAVERVITLGSPFSGDPRANHGWRLYEWVNKHPVDNPPVKVDRAVKPPVKTIALWSALDGIVAADSARGRRDESDHRIAVECRHMGFTTHPAALDAIFRALKL